MHISLYKKHPQPRLIDREQFFRTVHRAADLIFPAQTDHASETQPLQLILCGDKTMTELNQQFLGTNRATDVLAFDLRQPTAKHIHQTNPTDDPSPWGEVYVNLKLAMENADDFGMSWNYEIILYIVHGMLHLAGIDDNNDAAQKEMSTHEHEVMQTLINEIGIDGIFRPQHSRKKEA